MQLPAQESAELAGRREAWTLFELGLTDEPRLALIEAGCRGFALHPLSSQAIPPAGGPVADPTADLQTPCYALGSENAASKALSDNSGFCPQFPSAPVIGPEYPIRRPERSVNAARPGRTHRPENGFRTTGRAKVRIGDYTPA